METTVKYSNLGDLSVGDIWANRQHGVFVVVATEPAKWRGEDRDVYAHVDTWYTIRPATEAETALYQAALDAQKARRELRTRLIGNSTSYQFDAAGQRLVSTATALDSYDDRWQAPAPVRLSDEEYAVEQEYVEAIARLHGHK